MFAEGCGDVGDFEGAEQGDSGVAKNAHGGGGGSSPDAGVVFPEDDIAYPEEAVLDVPAAAPQGEQRVDIDLVARQAGHGVGHSSCGFAVNRGLAFQSKKLLNTRPPGRVDADGG